MELVSDSVSIVSRSRQEHQGEAECVSITLNKLFSAEGLFTHIIQRSKEHMFGNANFAVNEFLPDSR